jgi:hypothetical protein
MARPLGRDERLLRTLYAEHGGALLGYVERLTGGDRQQAEDVVQETLVGAGRNADRLESDGVGDVLVDADGAALYTADQERDGKVRCTTACAEIWIPLTLPAGGVPSGPTRSPATSAGRSDLTVRGSHLRRQAALPLRRRRHAG